MLLVTDIGNTHITLGVFSGNKLLAHWRISSGVTRTVDESWIMVKMLCQSENIQLSDITGSAISSVVPDQTPVYEHIFGDELNIPTVVVSSCLDTGIKILYDDPKSVGADRICNAVAGFKKYGGPLIIVDYGTATTFDVVSDKGEYLGGIIAPGVESSSFILHQNAAKLPKVELKFPNDIIGKNTESSMQAGIMFGTVELVNGIVRRVIHKLGKNAEIIATGGIAKLIFKEMDKSPKFEPFLTLDGLRLIYNMVMKNK